MRSASRPANARSPDNHLCRIRAETVGPLLFVNIDARAEPLGAVLDSLAPSFAMRLAASRVAGEVTTDYACNWKTYVEHCLSTRSFGERGDRAWLCSGRW